MPDENKASDLPAHSDFEQISSPFIDAVRDQMLAFARLQLDDYHLAEDVVQEALIAALQNRQQFRGESAFKSWVFAILKNKIIDCFRNNSKYTNISSLNADGEADEQALMDTLFNNAGHWYTGAMPSQFDNSWNNPDAQLHSEGFWKVFEACLTHLPSEQARAFLMKEYVELPTDEICTILEINNSHYYVLMHRARLRLQSCLTIRWFEKTV